MAMIMFSAIESQSSSFEQQINNFRMQKDEWMSTNPGTPIVPADLTDFTGLFYFPINADFRYKGTLIVDNDQNIEAVNQEDGNSVNLIRYGQIECNIEGSDYVLTAYKNISLPEFPGIPDAVFVPFKDVSSDAETYASGRYLIIRPPVSGDTVNLDFNMAVNPFADYNNAFSGLVPASNNIIEVAVVVGERKFNDRTRGDD